MKRKPRLTREQLERALEVERASSRAVNALLFGFAKAIGIGLMEALVKTPAKPALSLTSVPAANLPGGKNGLCADNAVDERKKERG